MKSKISCCRFVRSIGQAPLAARWPVLVCARTNMCSQKVARGQDGSKPAGLRRRVRAVIAMLAAVPRAGGGIGRRARLRALWTEWSVEVRVLFGALEKPRSRGAFLLSRAKIQAPPPSSSSNSAATNGATRGDTDGAEAGGARTDRSTPTRRATGRAGALSFATLAAGRA